MQPHKPLKVWYMLKKKQKLVSDGLYTSLPEEILGETLTLACHEFDVERPVVLPKHQRELDKFRRAIFTPRDFIGDFRYDTMEVECNPDKQEGRP